jgi:hypothetical protein
MHEGDNPSFRDEFIKLTFFARIIHFGIFKEVPKYLATGLKRPSGTNSPPAEASTQGLKCKTNTIPILMHQMRISTNQVSSVVLRPKKLEIPSHESHILVHQNRYHISFTFHTFVLLR